MLSLFKDAHEEVTQRVYAAGEQISFPVPGGAEIFVLEGGFSENAEEFGRWDWLRLPPGAQFDATAGADGLRIWMKTGHLAEMLNI